MKVATGLLPWFLQSSLLADKIATMTEWNYSAALSIYAS